MAQQKKSVESETVVEESAPKTIKAKQVDLHQYIPVRNGFQGKLIYRSRRTGELFVWETFGETQEMELQELKNAKASNKKFFESNWFMFDDDWVIDYLGVKQYYKYSLPVDDYDSFFEKDPDEMADHIAKMNAAQKRSLTYRARQLIAEGAIDSNRKIKVLEDALGVELIER